MSLVLNGRVPANSATIEQIRDLFAQRDEAIRYASTYTLGDEVFIVHGHDNEAKETVARLVENWGIEDNHTPRADKQR